MAGNGRADRDDRQAAQADAAGSADRQPARAATLADMRYLRDAPIPIAVVEGDAHTLVHANAQFRALARLPRAGTLGMPLADALRRAGRADDAPAAVPAESIVALLDRIRRDQLPVTRVNFAADEDRRPERQEAATTGSAGPGSVADFRAPGARWMCTAWPVQGRGNTAQIVIMLSRSSESDATAEQHREIAERMLVSALREQALSAENAELYRTASAARAIAEQAQERAELAQSRAESAMLEAEAANAAKSQFLANMSHELRTPLNAIGGYAQLMEMGVRGPVTEAQLTDLGRIQRSQGHLLGLINAILNFAKLEAGQVLYASTEVVLEEAVNDAEALIAPQLHARRLDYQFAQGAGGGPDATVIRVQTDPEKLQQILLNLLTNAIKYTPPGGAVTIVCREEDHMASIMITDTGRGIPPDKLRTIFDPFVQLDRHLSAPDSGVGLGLAISRELALGMGGDLTVRSVVGEGSTFTLVLPLAA